MNITTLFDVNDTVWFVGANTLDAQSDTVKRIYIKVEPETTSIRYEINENDIRDESKVFASQSDLAESFNAN